MNSRVLTWALGLSLAASARGQDVIHFLNGDRLTGKIKTLGRGQLVLDAPAMDGDANIDWHRIDRIESERIFQFETKDGERFSGRIAKDSPSTEAAVRDEIRILRPEGDLLIPQDDIVGASQTVGKEGIRLLEANLGAGVSIAKSNSQRQFNVDGSLNYQTTHYRVTATASSIFATQEAATDTNRQDLSFGFAREITRNWLFGSITGFQKSEEQNLDARIMIGGGPTRRIAHTNKMTLYASGGVIWNQERYTDESDQPTPTANQLEALAAVSFSYFRFRMLTFDSTLRVFPSITVGGRVRGDFNSSLRIRLVRGKKLWWSLGTGLLFDSAPPANGTSTDYATTTSLSYSFP